MSKSFDYRNQFSIKQALETHFKLFGIPQEYLDKIIQLVNSKTFSNIFIDGTYEDIHGTEKLAPVVVRYIAIFKGDEEIHDNCIENHKYKIHHEITNELYDNKQPKYLGNFHKNHVYKYHYSDGNILSEVPFHIGSEKDGSLKNMLDEDHKNNINILQHKRCGSSVGQKCDTGCCVHTWDCCSQRASPTSPWVSGVCCGGTGNAKVTCCKSDQMCGNDSHADDCVGKCSPPNDHHCNDGTCCPGSGSCRSIGHGGGCCKDDGAPMPKTHVCDDGTCCQDKANCSHSGGCCDKRNKVKQYVCQSGQCCWGEDGCFGDGGNDDPHSQGGKGCCYSTDGTKNHACDSHESCCPNEDQCAQTGGCRPACTTAAPVRCANGSCCPSHDECSPGATGGCRPACGPGTTRCGLYGICCKPDEATRRSGCGLGCTSGCPAGFEKCGGGAGGCCDPGIGQSCDPRTGSCRMKCADDEVRCDSGACCPKDRNGGKDRCEPKPRNPHNTQYACRAECPVGTTRCKSAGGVKMCCKTAANCPWHIGDTQVCNRCEGDAMSHCDTLLSETGMDVCCPGSDFDSEKCTIITGSVNASYATYTAFIAACIDNGGCFPEDYTNAWNTLQGGVNKVINAQKCKVWGWPPNRAPTPKPSISTQQKPNPAPTPKPCKPGFIRCPFGQCCPDVSGMSSKDICPKYTEKECKPSYKITCDDNEVKCPFGQCCPFIPGNTEADMCPTIDGSLCPSVSSSRPTCASNEVRCNNGICCRKYTQSGKPENYLCPDTTNVESKCRSIIS